MQPAPERLFTNLLPAQADGLACVACGLDFLRAPAGTRTVPVGRDRISRSQVFACVGPCAERFEQPAVAQ